MGGNPSESNTIAVSTRLPQSMQDRYPKQAPPFRASSHVTKPILSGPLRPRLESRRPGDSRALAGILFHIRASIFPRPTCSICNFEPVSLFSFEEMPARIWPRFLLVWCGTGQCSEFEESSASRPFSSLSRRNLTSRA
jgi:hypothetical protein